MIYVGIDPGKTGAIAAVNDSGELIASRVFDNAKIGCIVSSVIGLAEGHRLNGAGDIAVALESVHAMPGQGVTSMFSFGSSYGQIIGVLDHLDVPYLNPTPQLWQKVAELGKRNKDTDPPTKELVADWVVKQVGIESFIFGKRRKPHAGLVDATGIALWLKDKYGGQTHR